MHKMSTKQLQAVIKNLHAPDADIPAGLSSKSARPDVLVPAMVKLLDDSRMRNGFARADCAEAFAAAAGEAI
jgi:hypothetical protein